MAAGLFRAKIVNRDWQYMWRIGSAGTWAIDGLPVLPEVSKVMSHWDIDLSGHRSRQVNRGILSHYSLVLCMEAGQKEALEIEFAEFSQKIYTLGEMTGSEITVSDPAGGSFEEYRYTAELIHSIMARSRERMMALALDG